MKRMVLAGVAFVVLAFGLTGVASVARQDQNTNSNTNSNMGSNTNSNMNSNMGSNMNANHNMHSNTNSNMHSNAGMGQSMNSNMGGGMMKLSSSDMKFVMEAAMGGMMEVELGRLAAERGASDDVKGFGQRMVDDHSKANDELMQLAAAKGIMLPKALGAKHMAEVSKLSALSGAQFDREYVKHMVKAHNKDVAAFRKEATRGADADVKAFASKTLPTLEEHLRMVQDIHGKMMGMRGGNSNTNSR